MTKLYAYIGGGLILAIAIALHLIGDARLQGKYDTLVAESASVLTATRDAADNPELTWDNVPGQIVALGESNAALKLSLDTQNQRINELAQEAVRRQAEAQELRRIAARAQEQRRAALERLSDLSATPGTREDCMTLLAEAEEALDLVREAGL